MQVSEEYDEFDDIFDVGHRVRDLLEDFEFVVNISLGALIPNRPLDSTLENNIKAALAATTLRLKSLDYAKRTYCCNRHAEVIEDDRVKYVRAYKTAKAYMNTVVKRLEPDDKDLPSNGVFGASVVLERLKASFFSAHLLFRLGNEYEGYAVSRMILEQIAWAYSAYSMINLEEIQNIITTRSITKLKKLVPGVGILYNFLSNKTHIDYSSHGEFINIENNKNYVVYGHINYFDYARVILYLADLFIIVWEITQFHYLVEVESVEFDNGTIKIISSRPFDSVITELLRDFKK
jgi:hypothetical protein